MRLIVATVMNAGRRAVLLSLGLAVALPVLAIASSETGDGKPRQLQGVWYVQVTIRDCSSGVALAPPVNSLVTFTAGGTVQESVSGGGFAIGQRSSGHGTWSHKTGHTYDQRFVSMINFTTPPGPGPGFEAGWMKIQHTVEVVDADHIESAGTNSFYRWNGELYRSGCSSATGTRFE
jgi:hypothetical protein